MTLAPTDFEVPFPDVPAPAPPTNAAENAFWRAACAGADGATPPVLVLGLERTHVPYALAEAGHRVLVVDDHTGALLVFRSMTGRVLNHPAPPITAVHRTIRRVRRLLRARATPSLELLDADPFGLDLPSMKRMLRKNGFPVAFPRVIVPGTRFMDARDEPAFQEALRSRLEHAHAHLAPAGRLLFRTNNPLAPQPQRGAPVSMLDTPAPWRSSIGMVKETASLSPGVEPGVTEVFSTLTVLRESERTVPIRWIGPGAVKAAARGFAPPRRYGGYGFERLTAESPFCIWSLASIPDAPLSP